MEKPYFTVKKGDPPPLRIEVARRVRQGAAGRNGEVDVIAPIKKMHIDYQRPLSLMENFTIEGIMYWSDSLRINNEFIIRDSGHIIATTGYTVQLMLDRNNNLLLVPPPFIKAFREKWKAGELK